jgi:hypothetical protein
MGAKWKSLKIGDSHTSVPHGKRKRIAPDGEQSVRHVIIEAFSQSFLLLIVPLPGFSYVQPGHWKNNYFKLPH